MYTFIYAGFSTTKISKREPDKFRSRGFTPLPLASLPHHVVDADEFVVPEKHDGVIIDIDLLPARRQ